MIEQSESVDVAAFIGAGADSAVVGGVSETGLSS